ncbi:hypothetical protein ACHAW5_003389 [Stephanodiscus triporus]|uniref:Protein kinase domain-containing protein n=1 Tax=Stephanodiscus triporus TaxID=2934178 RepID=A0ABD3PRR4_9STRA
MSKMHSWERGGELFDRIVSKSFYNEKEARDTCKILLRPSGSAIPSRWRTATLKPENLLLQSEDSDSAHQDCRLRLLQEVLTPNSLTTQCGTPGYVAPRSLEGLHYDTKADMWSPGVIMYIILGGYPPFIEQNQRELFRKIRKGHLLTVQPSKRITADQALQHKWMLQDASVLAAQDLGANLSELRKYNAKRGSSRLPSTL